ncbi:kinase domain protein, partial [Candidatus Magnetomorum sp. HK-1]
MVELINGLLFILENLHSHDPPILHCDFNPKNIIHSSMSPLNLTIIDFGIARFLGEIIPQPMAYTPGFAAPEQIFSQ